MIWIFLVIVVLVIILFVTTYNSLVKLRNKLKDSWSQIDVVLKRRADLIPNLVETVKGYTKHEEDTLLKVVEARNRAVGASSREDAIKAEDELTKAISHLFALSESYPELKSNENFIQLQNSLEETENKITLSRQFYNNTVMNYNNKVEMFPTNLIAKLFGFEKESYFEISESDKETPKVQF